MTSTPQDGPPTTPAPVPKARQPGELVARLEQLGRQKPPPPAGRGIVLIVLGALAVAGTIHTLVFGGPVGRRLTQQIEERERQERPTGVLAPEAPAPAPAPHPTPAAAPTPTAAPDSASEPPVVAVDSAEVLALSVLHAPPEQREARRRMALEACAQLVEHAAHRRSVLEAVLRLANSAVPEEAPQWERLTAGAIAALDAPGDVGMALLYLGALRERAGPAGVQALERVVDDGRRPLEQRCAAARALPEGSRAPLLARVTSRKDAHPELVRALR